MKFSEHWLRQYVNPELSRDDLSHVLTMAGLEVDAVEPLAPHFSGVLVGRIMRIELHPDADKLRLCWVDVGSTELLLIVCGAANARQSLNVPCARIGAKLPGTTIKKVVVRGQESYGMLCSAQELGLAAASTGLYELPDDAPVGMDIRQYLNLDDHTITLSLTPNRSDCLSVLGIAREVATLTGASLTMPDIQPVMALGDVPTRQVTVRDAQACPRYCGRVIQQVNAMAVTPVWMRQRLESSGLRCVNAIVDITNYVLLEIGQPLHAFDLSLLSGDVEVRYAHVGESLSLLSGKVVSLDDRVLVIADSRGAIALAGVMGGDQTAISLNTQAIFLESAYFSPDVIAGQARRFGVSSDSAYRFERGVDFAMTAQALERATALIVQVCGGQAGVMTEVCNALPDRLPIVLRADRVSAILGRTVSEAEISDLMQRLGFAYEPVIQGLRVTPPSYRFDLWHEEDLIEEVARVCGYDSIEPVLPESMLQIVPTSGMKVDVSELKSRLVMADYFEVITYSFVDQEWELALQHNTQAIPLQNPIASNKNVMRSSLWGGLLDALRYNVNRQHERVRLYEVGACYFKMGMEYIEVSRIAGLCYGSVTPEQWGVLAREVDLYDVKSDIERLTNGVIRYESKPHPALHPGQSAQVILDGQVIGWLGHLHPQWQQQYALPHNTVLFELDIQPLLSRGAVQFTEIPRFPVVRRDIALVVDEHVTAQALIDVMMCIHPKSVVKVSLFDQYSDVSVGVGRKSLAFLVLMQDTERNLTDEDVDLILSQIVASVAEQFDVRLRS